MRWTKDKVEQLRALAAEGLRACDVGARMGTSLPSIYTAAARFGVKLTSAEASPEPARPIEARAHEEALKGRLREAKIDLRKALLKIEELSGVRELVAAACEELAPAKPLFKLPRAWRSKRDYAAVMLVSDWQVGEVIDLEESGGWGRYDYAVAERRAASYAENVARWVETQRHGYPIRRLRIVVLGDMVSGNIHDELLQTNEWPAPVAAVRAGDLLARTIHSLAPRFETVEVDFVAPDNHGRLTRRVRFKKAGEDSFNYIVFAVAQARLVAQANVEMRLHMANPKLLDIDGSGVLAMHGHGIKAWMGIPFYGLQRYQGRKAKVHMEKGNPFKLIVCGHWHAPAQLYGVVINGCLTGTTELDHTVGRYAPPSQTSFLWHPRHGVFNLTDWYFEEKDEAKS